MKGKYIIRAICFLPIAFIHLVFCLFVWVRIMGNYARYGGENIIYKAGEQRSIYDIYNLLANGVKATDHEE